MCFISMKLFLISNLFLILENCVTEKWTAHCLHPLNYLETLALILRSTWDFFIIAQSKFQKFTKNGVVNCRYLYKATQTSLVKWLTYTVNQHSAIIYPAWKHHNLTSYEFMYIKTRTGPQRLHLCYERELHV